MITQTYPTAIRLVDQINRTLDWRALSGWHGACNGYHANHTMATTCRHGGRKVNHGRGLHVAVAVAVAVSTVISPPLALVAHDGEFIGFNCFSMESPRGSFVILPSHFPPEIRHHLDRLCLLAYLEQRKSGRHFGDGKGGSCKFCLLPSKLIAPIQQEAVGWPLGEFMMRRQLFVSLNLTPQHKHNQSL